VREIDPFAYLVGHASAIEGFGGFEQSPDPRYCFHTDYLDVRPGRAIFRVIMTDAHATTGELSLRVHGFKEGTDVLLVASIKLALDGLDGASIEQVLRFTALDGVQYALFAFFSEPSDLGVASLKVSLEEPGDGVPVRANRGAAPASQFGARNQVPSPRLVGDEPPSLRSPVSQPCTDEQLESETFRSAWPAVAASNVPALAKWQMIAPLQALKVARMIVPGAQCLLLDPPHPVLAEVLVGSGVVVENLSGHADAGRWIDETGGEGGFDFVISHTLLGTDQVRERHLDAIGTGLRAVRTSCAAMFVLPFWSGTALVERPSGAADCLDRNDIQRIALRLIGQSYAVAQLAFPRPGRGGGRITSFLLTVHKPATV